MFKMRVNTAVAFISGLLSPLLLECTITCQRGNKNDYVEGHCPVKVTSVLSKELRGTYSECVTVRVGIKADDFCKDPVIDILSTNREIIRPMKKRKCKQKCDNERNRREIRVKCINGVSRNTSFDVWELVHGCVNAGADSVVTVSYSTKSTSCNVSYTVPDPIPDFDVSVNQSSKSITVTVEPGEKVNARWCYQENAVDCRNWADSPKIIDPSQSRSAVLNIPYLLPCVCVQVYYNHEDASRHKKCPFQNKSLADVRDVWRSSSVTLYGSKFSLHPVCPANDLKISASLCWRQHELLCTPVLNSTLEGGPNLIFNISELDTHPQMCVQFSLQDSHNISCPFQADMSSWEVHVGPGRKSMFLYLTSSVRAKFSAQLCLLNERECTPVGQVHSVTMDSNTISRINVPLHFLAEKPCVQVWQSDPALRGRRILCPDYTHNRCGMYAVASLIFVVIVLILGIFIHRLTKSGAAGWLCIEKPVLLVCSSEESAHVSAVCALASVLQGELSATVHMALWAQSSQTKARTGVADLGPLPWLYGQWESVRKAQGKVVIIWSAEAKKTYEKWWEERANVDKNVRKKEDCSKAEMRHEEIRVEMAEDLKLNGRSPGNGKKGKKYCVELCHDEEWYPSNEPSAVIAPVFTAALACLEGALQGCKGQGVVLVYFQGLCHSRDIPKSFRGVPRYCLPQDFRGLIQELGGMRRPTKTGKFMWHCCPRLLFKVLSVWLGRQLAQRLKTLLPQT
ncbi:interleukin-17 receptor E [Micropterus salmoides]|uniref:interleukin-17 receptor E n=1 Tax=Micropterus salmoides TaxID=27706 RepID=UPI0018EA4FB0|nr:interleukin-17 receptor E [Micropterus salmoides]